MVVCCNGRHMRACGPGKQQHPLAHQRRHSTKADELLHSRHSRKRASTSKRTLGIEVTKEVPAVTFWATRMGSTKSVFKP